MELINYLNKYFYTKQALLDVAKISEQELLNFQYQGVMPLCSYKLNLNLKCDSFLGEHSQEQVIEYYAMGYASWLGIIQSLVTREKIYSVFVKRYKTTIEQLREQGHCSDNAKITTDIDQHLKEEWGHFLSGTYGLCTKSGLPEDIAAKEFAILEINEITEESELNIAPLTQLTNAINLLDSASALFAPHERPTSSRHRLVNEMRRKYRLKNQ